MLTPEAGADQDRRTTQLDELGRDILAWTGNQAQIVDVTPAVLAAMVAAGDPLVESWRVDDVHLAGTRLLDLLRQVRAS